MTIHLLPPEMWYEVFKHMDAQEAAKTATVCHFFHDTLESLQKFYIERDGDIKATLLSRRLLAREIRSHNPIAAVGMASMGVDAYMKDRAEKYGESTNPAPNYLWSLFTKIMSGARFSFIASIDGSLDE